MSNSRICRGLNNSSPHAMIQTFQSPNPAAFHNRLTCRLDSDWHETQECRLNFQPNHRLQWIQPNSLLHHIQHAYKLQSFQRVTCPRMQPGCCLKLLAKPMKQQNLWNLWKSLNNKLARAAVACGLTGVRRGRNREEIGNKCQNWEVASSSALPYIFYPLGFVPDKPFRMKKLGPHYLTLRKLPWYETPLQDAALTCPIGVASDSLVR